MSNANLHGTRPEKTGCVDLQLRALVGRLIARATGKAITKRNRPNQGCPATMRLNSATIAKINVIIAVFNSVRNSP